ncbi:zinc finger protein 438 [Callorhinchus milii]|uniref:zinc finger protein 438 n=1 Tax=Callorhinchus milii TaxID=7868 RepID=UPI001C3F99E3|nr:zinc finger protein 438 [Callorhinchus milii]
MTEDPNGSSKESEEEFLKKDTVFQDLKLPKDDSGVREHSRMCPDELGERVLLQNEIKREVDYVDDGKKQNCEEMQDSTNESSKLPELQLFHYKQDDKQQALQIVFCHLAQEKLAGMADVPNSILKEKDVQGSSSNTSGQKRSLQTKAHFRTIAPKVTTSVITNSASSLVPHSPVSGVSTRPASSPDSQSSKLTTTSTKPIIMPSQSYALMPIAGKEGTYSLVALPQVSPTPARASPQVCKPIVGPCTSQPQASQAGLQPRPRPPIGLFRKAPSNVAPAEVLKLPIPRYQSIRAKPAPEKGLASTMTIVKPSNEQNQTCQQPVTPIQVQSASVSSHSPAYPNLLTSKQGLLAEGEKAPADLMISVTVAQGSGVMPRHSSSSKTDVLKPSEVNRPVCLSASPSMDGSLPQAVPMKVFPKPNPDSLSATSTCTLSTWSVVQNDKQSPLITQAIRPPSSMPVMQFGNSVQFIAPAPKGKVPILPYSRVKGAIFLNSKPNQTPVAAAPAHLMPAPSSLPSVSEQTRLAPTSRLVPCASGFSVRGESKPGSQKSSELLHSDYLRMSPKVVIIRLKKPISNLPKHRLVRKRKVTDNVAISRTKRFKASNLFSRMQEDKDKVKRDSCPQETGTFKTDEDGNKAVTTENSDKTAAVLKKFCNIMPKPVMTVQAVAPLPSPAGMVTLQNFDSIKSGMAPSSTAASRPGHIMPSEHSVSAKLPAYCRNLPAHLVLCKQVYKCNVCSRGFQFKHHLQDHLNIHSNSRPYCCRICHKAYSHSGSLSTHMKRRHSDIRRKKLMCCEFCAKLFGHIGVYFSHLKEIHKILISGDFSSQHLAPDNPVSVKSESMGAALNQLSSERKRAGQVGDESLPRAAAMGPGNLQIRCSRCQVITPTFVEMKLHLLCVHREELQLRVEEGTVKEKGRFLSGLPIYTSKETEQELYKHAANYWKQPVEKKPLVKCGVCDKTFYSYAKLKKHVLLRNKERPRLQAGESRTFPKRPDEEIHFFTSLGYNCILCKLGCESKVELIGHWQSYHNCEDPAVLWAIFSSANGNGRTDREEWPGISPEHSTGSGETCYGQPEGTAAQTGLEDEDRTSECECRVHSGSSRGGTMENHQLICPFCLKTFSCSSFGEEVVLEQEHQCPKCLVKFSLTAKGLGARVLCSSSKHCGHSTSASKTEESVRLHLKSFSEESRWSL